MYAEHWTLNQSYQY